jgi:hypothetical protein
VPEESCSLVSGDPRKEADTPCLASASSSPSCSCWSAACWRLAAPALASPTPAALGDQAGRHPGARPRRRPAAGAARRGAQRRHRGGGRVLPGRGGPPAAGRGVPPQPAVGDRLHRRLGAPDQHAPLRHRRWVMDTATRLLDTDRISVQGCSAAASRSMTPRRPTAGSTTPPGRRQGTSPTERAPERTLGDGPGGRGTFGPVRDCPRPRTIE